jgi:hypothetical protein
MTRARNPTEECRLRIGAFVLDVTMRHPAVLAQELATLARWRDEEGDVVARLEQTRPALAAAADVDSDGDGLTDTEEGWWCTDPHNPRTRGLQPTDGETVDRLLQYLRQPELGDNGTRMQRSCSRRCRGSCSGRRGVHSWRRSRRSRSQPTQARSACRR